MRKRIDHWSFYITTVKFFEKGASFKNNAHVICNKIGLRKPATSYINP